MGSVCAGGQGRVGAGTLPCDILRSFYNADHVTIWLETSMASYCFYYKIQTLSVSR